MKSSNELHQLIQSLSMNEKRHFKLLSQRHALKGGNSYIQLFDSILDQEEYNEGELKRNLDKAGRLRFATEKNYLQGLIIDSLIHFHRSRQSVAVYQKLISIDILYEKKMFKACLKQARKGKVETLKLEKLFPALSFIRWEAALLTVTGGESEMDAVIQEERDAIAALDVQAEIMQYSFRLRNLLSTAKVKQDELKSIISGMDNVMKKAEKDKSRTFLTIYYYHSALAMKAAFMGSHEDRKKSYRLIHKHLETHPWFIADIPHIYNNNMNNIVNACIFLDQYEEAMSWIEQQRGFMSKINLKNEAMMARIFLNTHENEIFIYSRQKDYKKGIPLVKSVEQGLRKFGEYYQGEQYDVILSLAILLYGGKDLRGAARWLNRIASVRTAVQLRPEILITAKLALLIVHYENKEENIGYLLKSSRKWLEKSGLFKSAGIFVEFIEAMHDKLPAKEKKIRCIRQWNAFRKAQEDPNEKLISKYFDFENWMKKTAEIRLPMS